MLFGKREVFTTYSEPDLYQVQHALEQAGIDYVVRQKDTRLHGGARMRWGGDPAAAIQYRIFVAPQDEEWARSVIGRC